MTDHRDARAKAWETRRAKYGAAGHAGSYRRGGGYANSAGLLALVIRLHIDGTLSEGQVCSASGLDRVEVRKLADEHRDERDRQRLAGRHASVPHPRYPWFCNECGYAPHEQLKHRPS